ncbi:MAG TPA: ABC transporter ATP-binding protein [Clostridia bacterium]|nr:ABC transporter ATP-binding protein [Clostridia bacterium]
MSEFILETKMLNKSYGDVKAVRDFSVGLESNKIYGLLGRNGAGKTTFLNIIASRIFADSGEVSFFGQNAIENQEVLEKICYMPEKDLFIDIDRVSRILKTAALFYDNFDMEYALRLCKKFELSVNKKYKNLSRGYESIIRIVVGLASRAPLTIFDEPVLGLDAAVRDLFYRELIEDYENNPRTYIISTHLIEESADVFEEALIIKDGMLVEKLTVEELKERARYVSGKASAVDEAVSGMNIVHTEMVGNIKICTIFEKLTDEKLKKFEAAGTDVSPVPVQKLFIYLTEQDKEVMI